MPEGRGAGFSGPRARGALLGGRPVRARGPSGGSVRPGPQTPRPLSPSPLSSLGGRCPPAAFLPRGWDEPAPGKGLSGPRPPAPAQVSNLMYLNTHKNLHGGFVTRAQPGSGPSQSGGRSKKKKKKIDLVASSLSFSCVLCLSSDSGLPGPWEPRDSGLWFGKLADEVFVTQRREVGGRSSGRVQSLALVECETPGQHP